MAHHIRAYRREKLTGQVGRQPSQEEVNVYLDRLRASGVTNMFGAPAYMMRKFGMDKQTAFTMWEEWARTFSQRHPVRAGGF